MTLISLHYRVASLVLALMCPCIILFSQDNIVEGLVVEKVESCPHSLAPQEHRIAYLVFVDLAADHRITAVYGEEESPLLIRCEEGIPHWPESDIVFAHELEDTFKRDYPYCADSYLTIGANGYNTIAQYIDDKWVDVPYELPPLGHAGIDLSTLKDKSASQWKIDEGGLFQVKGFSDGSEDNLVLIAKVVSPSIERIAFNIQVTTPSKSSERYFITRVENETTITRKPLSP